MLGRTFLLGTYIKIDYERAIFDLHQAYPEGGSTCIIPISAVTNSTITPKGPASDNPEGSRSLSSGAVAWIDIGVTTAGTLVIELFRTWKKLRVLFRTNQIKQDY